MVQGLTIDGEAKQLFNDEELEKIRTNTYTTAEKTEFALRESAYRTEGVILNGRGCELIGCTVRDVMGTAVLVSGDNAYVADNYISNVGGGIVTGCKNGIIENNEINRINCFYGEGGSGDVFRLFGNNVIIRRNYAHGTAEDDVWHALSKTAAHADFIQSFDDNKTESGNMLIENNIALGFYHQGIMLENDAYGASTDTYYLHDWTIRKNLFVGFRTWGVCAGKAGGGIPNINIYNNTFVSFYHDGRLPYYGIGLSGVNGSATVKNNIIV